MSALREPRKRSNRMRYLESRLRKDARLALAFDAVDQAVSRYGLTSEDLANIAYFIKQRMAWNEYRTSQERQV